MSKAKLKKYMSALSKEQVVDIMLQLYDASKEANSWLEFYLEPNSDAELEKYKKAIRSQFYGRNDWPKDPSFRECNKLITVFKKHTYCSPTAPTASSKPPYIRVEKYQL